MAKTLVPHKVVIEFEDGQFVNGVLIYKINDNGVISRYRSVGIKNADFRKTYRIKIEGLESEDGPIEFTPIKYDIKKEYVFDAG